MADTSAPEPVDDAPAPVSPPASGPAALAGWTLVDLLIGAAIALGTGLLLAVLLAAVQATGLDLGPRVAALGGLPALYIPLSLSGSLIAGLALWALHRRRLPAAPRPWTSSLVWSVIALALGLQGVAVGFTALTDALGVRTAGSNLAVIQQAFDSAPWLTLLAAVVVAPLGEELVFRRVLLHRFAQAARPGLGLLVTSLGFALIHEPSPGSAGVLAWLLTLATYATLGAGFGLLYLRSGRLDAVVLAHVLVNASGMALLLAGPRAG